MIKQIKFYFIILFVFPISTYGLEPYVAEYKFKNNAITFAKSHHSLEKNETGWTFITSSQTVGLFSLKRDKRKENSKFIFENNKPITMNYEYYQDKSSGIQKIVTLRKENDSLISYNNDQIIIHDDKFQTDRLLAQMFGYKYTNDDNVPTLDKSRERIYKFSFIKHEEIETILGIVKTIVIKKEILKSKRSTKTWYAVEYEYLPVKIEQYRLNELKFTAEISFFQN